MTNTAMRHPRVLTSLVIVRDRSEFSHRSAIRSVALFHVTQCREVAARFAVDHYGFDRESTRSQILDGIAARVPQDATLIARAPRMPRRYPHPRFEAGEPSPPADLQLIQRLRPDLRMQVFDRVTDALNEIGSAFEIERASRAASVVARGRNAPNEAQCLWLAYLWTFCRSADRTSLTAAWQAWSALQRARPMPF